ncbi:MAG: integrase core domain-containing protein [Pirellulaceae bacterium]|nr:integrase core domain-containing protein [Pirellulaceae bacterium]
MPATLEPTAPEVDACTLTAMPTTLRVAPDPHPCPPDPSHLSQTELLNELDARLNACAWQHDFNQQRPHSLLGYLTPPEFALRCGASSRRVGTGDCSPAPLTEPDLWAHIRLLKLNMLEQHKLP